MRRTVFWILLLAPFVRAQEAPWDVDPLDGAALQQSRADAQKRLAESPADGAKDLRAALEERITLLDQLLRTLEEAASLLSPAEVQKRKQDAEAAFERLKVEETPPVAAGTTAELAPYEQAFREVEAEHKTRKDALEQLTARRKSAEEELGQFPAREAEVKKALEAARATDPEPLSVYRAANRRLEVRLLQERGKFL